MSECQFTLQNFTYDHNTEKFHSSTYCITLPKKITEYPNINSRNVKSGIYNSFTYVSDNMHKEFERYSLVVHSNSIYNDKQEDYYTKNRKELVDFNNSIFYSITDDKHFRESFKNGSLDKKSIEEKIQLTFEECNKNFQHIHEIDFLQFGTYDEWYKYTKTIDSPFDWNDFSDSSEDGKGGSNSQFFINQEEEEEESLLNPLLKEKVSNNTHRSKLKNVLSHIWKNHLNCFNKGSNCGYTTEGMVPRPSKLLFDQD
ncbi:uncharacterized protein I206_103856 [Kwoniella pini CBS 10737]|uniref:Uncharacterized protein n=1 Tax=Kwoniella pini CBS 10737 TaxID=1296096 RepID=A0A1B9HST2_9TREE|nr:uncharacterized protein I206_07809 [Kwoniella pini CBS 10737]OCF46327.1 hypothetical protein I206_07809 [Kwoniella pini CBS 10737]